MIDDLYRKTTRKTFLPTEGSYVPFEITEAEENRLAVNESNPVRVEFYDPARCVI